MAFTRRELIRNAAITALSLPFVANAKPAKKSAPPAADPQAPTLAHRILSKAAYGPTPELLELLHRKPFAEFVESQLHPAQLGDKVCDDRLKALNLTTLGKPLTKLWTDHMVEPNKMRDDAKMKSDVNKLRQQPALETEMATWTRAVYSQRQLLEVMSEFWHDHFNVHAFEGHPAAVFVHYDRDVIRPHVFGNFRQMLEAVAASPAMLFYLDNFVNQSKSPNENFARELLELHTLGAENYLGTEDRKKVGGFATGKPVGYVDGDVYEAARCFTGWGVDTGGNSGETGVFVYADQHHDRFQKIVLGRSVPELQPPRKDGQMVLDILTEHPGTARFLARKLCRRLVGDTPPDALVQSTAKVFQDHLHADDQLAQVTRHILLSPEFANTWGEKLKRPFDATVSLLRATHAEFTPTEKFINQQARSGQRRFQWRTPDGYPDRREKWANTNLWLERWRLTNQLLNNRIDGVKIDLAPIAGNKNRTPRQLAQFWSARLLGLAHPKSSLEQAIDLLARGRGHDRDLASDQINDRLAPTVALLAMSPEFQVR